MKLLCLTDPNGDPCWNMAVDEWLLRKVSRQRDTIYLRVYSWSRECITIGYHQNYNRAVCHQRLGDTPVVRRVTGGRALLHELSELTYAIAAPIGSNLSSKELFGHTLAASGRLIAESLRDALAAVGIPSELVRGIRGGEIGGRQFHSLPCIVSTSRFELVSGRRKLVASAQRRLRGAFLQHGSIKIKPARQHPALEVDCKGKAQGDQQFNPEIITSFAAALRHSLASSLGLTAKEAELSTQELTELRLRHEKVSQKPLHCRTIY